MADELNIITSDTNSVNVTTEDRTITITNDSDTNTITLSAAETTTIQIATIGPQGPKGDSVNINTGSLATTGSNTFLGNQNIVGNVTITGSLIVSSSSTFINEGPAIFSGSVTSTTGFTGPLLGTASFATTASYALNAGAGAGFPYSGSAVITGSLFVTEGITGSLKGTADTASYYNETDPIFTAKSASLATTGSNTFKGNQTITGSVNILIPAGTAYGINENPTANNIFYSYPSQDTNTAAVQIGWTANVQGGGTYTVTNVETDTPYPPFISITLSDPSLILSYRIGVDFSSPAKLWKFNNNGTTDIPDDINISGSISFEGGGQITPTFYGYNNGGIDVVAGPEGFAELASNNSQSYVWVDDNGAFVVTSNQHQFEFRDDGYFVIPQVQSLTKQAGIISAGDIIIQADESQSWRFSSGSAILYAPGPIEAVSFTGSLKGTATTASYYDETDPIYTAEKAKYLTTGSNNTTQTINGSLVINQNLTVLGSSSITYVTSSQLDISTNIIRVSTSTPAVRFGGLAVYDSGSTGKTGSILWDSQNDVWIYNNPSGAAYDGAMFLVGPRSSIAGNEVGITTNYLAKGDGSHHMTSSVIWNSGSLIRLETNTQITGSLNVSGGITGSFSGSVFGYVPNTATASFIINSQTGSFATTGSNTFRGNQTITGSLIVSGSITGSLFGTASFATSASFATTAISSSRPIAVTGSTIYSTSPLSTNTPNTDNNIFLGSSAGAGATNANNANFLGYYAGAGAVFANNSNFIGYSAGKDASDANNSNFIGYYAGYNQSKAAYSIMIGHRAGSRLDIADSLLEKNNIIIGTGISLPTFTANAINIGGIIFGSGSHYGIGLDTPIFTGSAGGSIGINVVNPSYNFEVSGTVAFPSIKNNIQSNVVSINTSTGQLFYQPTGVAGAYVAVLYTGSTAEQSASVLNFTGSGVMVTGVAGTTTIEIPGINTLNTKIAPNDSGSILTFNPMAHHSCFIEYHTFLADETPTVYASRAGNLKISVPHNYDSITGPNIPFVEQSTENHNTNNTTTEDIRFEAYYSESFIRLNMINDNSLYNASINAQYKLIELIV